MGYIKLIVVIFFLVARFADSGTLQNSQSINGISSSSAQKTKNNNDKIQNADQLYKFQFSEKSKQNTLAKTAKRAATSTAKPRSFILHQNYPNPFNARTFLKFEITKETFINLDIYDARGKYVTRLLASLLAKGMYIAPWDATNDDGATMSSGIYYARISNDNSVKIIRMVLLR